jgi:hypothetical protein
MQCVVLLKGLAYFAVPVSYLIASQIPNVKHVAFTDSFNGKLAALRIIIKQGQNDQHSSLLLECLQ